MYRDIRQEYKNSIHHNQALKCLESQQKSIDKCIEKHSYMDTICGLRNLFC